MNKRFRDTNVQFALRHYDSDDFQKTPMVLKILDKKNSVIILPYVGHFMVLDFKNLTSECYKVKEWKKN